MAQPQAIQNQPQDKSKNEQNPLTLLADHFDDEMRGVNALIIEHMQSPVPLIPQLANYLIAAGGKRIRPILTLACNALCEGPKDHAAKLAAAVEFIHSATLLHDDVVDESRERRGQDSANEIFGNQASVLVGDFLFSKSFQLMVATDNIQALKILSDASATIAQGEVLQLSKAGSLTTNMEDYKAIIHGKTAALFAAACEVAPVIANLDQEKQDALRTFGTALGMAFQIADDALDYDADRKKLGKTIGDDFREGKLTAPVLFALEAANEEERAFWQTTMEKRHQQEGDLQRAQELIKKHKGIEKSVELANGYVKSAQDSLGMFPPSQLRDWLSALAAYTVTRQS